MSEKTKDAWSCTDTVPPPAAGRNDQRGAKFLRASHTQGPWMFDGDERVTSNHLCIALVTGGLDGDSEFGPESAANAHLIAAAPALLAALKECADTLPPKDAGCHYGICEQAQCGRCSRIQRALNAIAKAEGRA